MPEDSVDLSVIIVSWNVRGLLEPCLRSIIHAARGLSAEIFVVDNASHDGSVEMVRQVFPDIQLIANRENKGFGAANNQALRVSQGKYALLINPDTVVPKNAIRQLIAFMEKHPQAGIVGPEQRGGNGELHMNWVRWSPREAVIYFIELLASIGRQRPPILFPRPRQVPVLNGGCWLVRLEALEQIGYFDEDLFMYAEEPDVCDRMRGAGWEIWFLRNVEIVHYRRQSIRQRGLLIEVKLFIQSMISWLRKRLASSRFIQSGGD
jgi:GT2 family glycosyltransferase